MKRVQKFIFFFGTFCGSLNGVLYVFFHGTDRIFHHGMMGNQEKNTRGVHHRTLMGVFLGGSHVFQSWRWGVAPGKPSYDPWFIS